MASEHEPLVPGRGQGTEIWLLRACTAAQRAPGDLVRVFAPAPPAQVYAEPSGDGHGLGRALAAGWEAVFTSDAGLAHPGGAGQAPELARRAWPALERALVARAPARILFVTGLDVLRALVARALDMPPERSSALWVDPGKLVLLRDDPPGLVLRRSNVLGPEARPGASLPGTDGAWGPAGSPGARR